MATIAIALDDIVLDPEQPVDVTALPEEEAVARIKDSFGFLATEIEVTIREGVAVIMLPEERAQRASEALKLYERGLRSAQRGDYQRAIQQFQQALAVLPAHADARRNLGMAYEEIGEIEQAKDHVIEALKLNPKDAWSYILLGNIYMKHESNLDRAERLYRRALELSPNDAMLLTNYGSLMANKGNSEQAEEFFERAIEADPKYPNSYYALAVLGYQQGRRADAIGAVDRLFERSYSSDRRSEAVYSEARRLYKTANAQLAESAAEQLTQAVERRREALEREGGAPIRLVQDDSLKVWGKMEARWRHSRDYHVVRYRGQSAAVTPHIVAHELEHLDMEMEARRAGLNRVFATSAETRELAARSVSDQVAKIKRMGLAAADIDRYLGVVIDGMVQQLFSIPVDMIIEQRLFDRLEAVRPSQFVSLEGQYEESMPVLKDAELARLTPIFIHRASLALNCTMALFMDDLYDGKTAYAEPYRNHNAYSVGLRLYRLWQDRMEAFQPGDEYALVDEFARALRLDRWYVWLPDEEGGQVLAAQERGGSTNPKLLAELKPAALWYLLDALRRMDRMTEDQIRRLATEVSLIGTRGLDYSSSEFKYTLSAFPGEQFTGLQMMCFMYASLKHVEPMLDAGMPFEEEYAAAVAMHRSGQKN